ncbi:MAG: FAD-dependent oxidoreductase [Deltaproteobacteria bacterium]|nr:FAD-dependent oxidoreductase [Deltaproteobacteria bacterium]
MRDPRTVIIGGGLGGLTTAVILARLGRPVTVVEQQRHLGGLVRGYRRAGRHCPVGVHYLACLGPAEPLGRLWDWLGVRSLVQAVPLGQDGVVDRYLLAERDFTLPRGLAALEDALMAAFPGEAPAVRGFLAGVGSAARAMSSLEGAWPPPPPPAGADPLETSGELWERLGASAGLREVLNVTTSLLGAPPEECPAWLHQLTLAGLVISPWRLAGGGGEDLAQALAARLAALGGRALTGVAAARVELAGGRVSGVHLADGRRLEAERVVLATHPKLLPRLLAPGSLKPRQEKRLAALVESESMLGVQAMLPAADELPPGGRNYFLGPREGEPGAFFQLSPGADPGEWFLTALCPSPWAGWQPWEATSSGQRGADYNERKHSLADKLLRQGQSRLGPWPGLRVLDVYTPLTLRDWVGTHQGAAYGIMRSCRQTLDAAFLLRNLLGGLYLTGQSILAPGVLGTTFGAMFTVSRMEGQAWLTKELGLAEGAAKTPS